MSKIAIKGNESGTATFTIEAPATNTNRVLELPDEAGKVLTDVSDLEPQVKTATNASGAAPVYACRAWVNFNGTGTVAIRASGNVSSITDNGIGDYTVNFTTAMPDEDYTPVAGALGDTEYGTVMTLGGAGATGALLGKFVGSLRVHLRRNAGNTPPLGDTNEVNLAIFR